MGSQFKNLKAIEASIRSEWDGAFPACMGCGDCRTAVRYVMGRYKVCPAREHTAGFEPFFARGKMRIIRSLLEGSLKPSESLANVIYQCMVCGSCKWVCHQSLTPQYYECGLHRYIDHVKTFEALRADLVEAGYGPMPRHKEIFEWCRKEHNPYMEKHEDRVKWLRSHTLPRKGKLIYFMGCTEPYRHPELCQAFLDIMDAADVEFAILHPDEWCCGSVAFRTGVIGVAKELAMHNIEAFRAAGAKTVVTHCAGCYRTLKIDYPEVSGGELPFRVVHASELIKDLIDEGKLKLKRKIEERITYHDPCHLGRHSGVYDPPRQLIKAIGAKLVEMKRIRENAWCCGAGGGVKAAFPDLAVEIAVDRITEAEETGAQILASVCPFCLTNLRDASKVAETAVQVTDILELIQKLI